MSKENTFRGGRIKMNVFEKLQQARVTLQKMNIKMTGHNKFAKYYYYDLGDILPSINDVFLERKLFSFIGFTEETATLTIVNIEKPDEKILFTCPMSSANTKGCHEVQNLGSVKTYIKRYLYMDALEIIEHDALDMTNDPKKEISKKSAELSDEEKATIEAEEIANSPIDEIKKKTIEQLLKDTNYAKAKFLKQCKAESIETITTKTAIDGIKWLEQLKEKQAKTKDEPKI